MNEFLPSRFTEIVHRLALGIEPLDSQLQLRIAQPIQVSYDAAVLGLPRPPVDHHPTSLHAIRYLPGVTSPVDLRFDDPTRRFVPRRLRIPILSQSDAEANPVALRVRRPVLFPGAAYDVGSRATGLRGLVVRAGGPVRWARVEARLSGGGALVGRAHGDDRGEFLLLIGSEASPMGDLTLPLQLDVQVFAGPPPPQPPPASAAIDPLWDLPLEALPNPGAADNVSTGEKIPDTYTASVTTPVTLAFGRMASNLIFTIA
jgi:hypothetical protein